MKIMIMNESICSVCNNIGSMNAMYCSRCGNETNPELMAFFCMRCGLMLDDNANYCSYCRAPVPKIVYYKIQTKVFN